MEMTQEIEKDTNRAKKEKRCKENLESQRSEMPGFKNILTIKNKHVHLNLERSQVEDTIDRFGGAEGQICPSHQCFLFVKKGEKITCFR